jgi:hypothetical protein
VTGEDGLITIEDDDALYRRLAPPFHFKPDGTVSSRAYWRRREVEGKKIEEPDPEISVDLAKLTTQQESLARGRPGFGLGELKAHIPRSLGLPPIYRPLPDNSAHCQCEGENTKEKCYKLAEATEVIIKPAPRGNT